MLESQKRPDRFPKNFQVLTLLLFAIFLSCSQQKMQKPKTYFPSPETWENKTFYMAVTDRFIDGDSTNNNLSGSFAPKNPYKVHGGDFKGVTKAIPYLKSLGVDVLWLTPIQKQAYGEYHGYAISDFYSVNPTLGTFGEFRELVKTAHQHEIYICLDVVVNHSGDLLNAKSGKWEWNPEGYELAYKDKKKKHLPKVFQNPELFHNFGNVADWNDPKQVLYGEFPGGLDDFKTENPIVREEMLKIWSWWIEHTDVDAFRIDTAKHVEISFWNDFIKGIKTKAKELGKDNFWIFAESYDFEDYKNQRFLNPDSIGKNTFDSVLNYTLWGTQKEVFGKGASVRKLAETWEQNKKSFGEKTCNKLMTFVENHDQPRLLSYKENANPNLLKLALAYDFTSPGIPIVYYGAEIPFKGGKDPKNREDFFKIENPLSIEKENFKLISYLSNLRKKRKAISQGSFEIYFVDEKSILYKRSFGAEKPIWVAINLSNEKVKLDLPKRGIYYLNTYYEIAMLLSSSVFLEPYSFEILTQEK